MIKLPNYAMLEDTAITTVIAKPRWLYVWRSTDLETGDTWLSVYRSVLVRDTDSMFQEARVLIGDAELLRREDVTDDDEMMHGRAEFSMWGPLL